MLVAFLLRLYHIDRQELWFDEAISVHIATTANPLRDMVPNNTPPLYYLSLRLWAAVFGDGETALRLLSATLGTAFVASIIWIGAEVFRPSVGLWSGLVAATSLTHIYYSQEVRSYILLMLALAVTYGTFWRAFATNSRGWWALACGCVTLSLYSHYLAVLGLLPTGFLLVLWRDRSRWTRYVTASVTGGLLFLPWGLARFGTASRNLNVDPWVEVMWERTGRLGAIPLTLELYSVGSEAGRLPIRLKQLTFLEFPAVLWWLAMATVVLLGIWLAVPAGDRFLQVPRIGWRRGWVAVSVLVPLGALWLISFHTPLYLAGRYDLVGFAMFPVLLGLALGKAERLPRVGLLVAGLAALGLLVPVGWKLVAYYRAPAPADAREAARVLAKDVRDGDIIVFTGARGLPVIYYLSHHGFRWDHRYCVHAGGKRFACRLYPRSYEHPESPAIPDLDDFLQSGGRRDADLWLVFEWSGRVEGGFALPPRDARLVREILSRGFTAVGVTEGRGILRFVRS
jgi:4-amino-4-deoxy-L-arabinose transferase-like glycosyltransferase